MLYLLKEDGYRLLQESGDKINLETLFFLIDVVDTVNITESYNGNETLDVNIYDSITIDDVWVTSNVMEINVSDQINTTEATTLFIPEYFISVSDQINITEYTAEARELKINVWEDIGIDDETTTITWIVTAFDGVTASRWGFIEQSTGRSVTRGSDGFIYTTYISFGSTYSNYEIWISRSTDGGKIWAGGLQEKMVYRSSAGSQFSPKIAIDSSDNIYIVWVGPGAVNNPTINNIALKKGTFSNIHTQPRIDITDSTVAQNTVSTAVDSYDNLHIIFPGSGYGTNSTKKQIVYAKYLSTGSLESAPINITDEPNDQNLPEMVIDRFNNLHIAWYGIYTGEATFSKILYKKYDKATEAWGSVDTSLVPVGSSGYFPSLALDSNDKVHIAFWHSSYIKYSNFITGSWAALTSIINTQTLVPSIVARPSLALDKQNNIYIAAEASSTGLAIFDVSMSRYRNGAWQTTKFYSFSPNFQTKPNLMFFTHPMKHKQQGIPFLGTLGVWVNSISPSSSTSAGNIMFHSDIDLAYQTDLYIDVHQDIGISENNEFLLLQLYIPDVYDSVLCSEGQSLSQGPNSPATTVNLKNSTLIDSYPDSNRSSTITPFRSGSFVDVGQPFLNTNISYLDSATFYLSKILAPTGNATARLYAMTGTYGTDAKPTGAALATSDNYDITGTLGLVNFTFSGAERILLAANTYYCILVNFSGVTGDASNYMGFGIDSTTPSHGGNIFYSSGGAYSVNTAWDSIFYVYSTNINDVAWSDPNNSQVSDDVYSTVVLPEVTMFVNDPLIPGEWTNEFTSRLGSYQNWSQSFTNATPIILDRIVWPLNKVGTPTGNVYAKIYAHSGTYGTSSKPTGEPLAISDPIDITTIPVNADFYFTYVTFNFSGAERISLDANTHYCAVLDIQAGSGGNYLYVPNDYTGTTADGNGAYSHDGITYSVTGDGYLYVYGVTTSQYLKASNFGFSIPTGRTILGIKVDIEQKTTGYSEENTVKIVKADGSIGTTNRSTRANLPASDTYVTYGSHLDLWGETWTAANINDVDFGVVFATDGIGTSSVDHIRITIYYSTMRPDLMMESAVSVSDLINITEDVFGENPSLIDLNDLISISESTILQISDMEVSVSDSITISESVTVTLSLLGNINIVDSVTMSESTTIINSSLGDINKFDSINITEDASIFFLNWVIDIYDLINISENLNNYGFFNIPVSENITISEQVIVILSQLGGINIFDPINITESITSVTPLLGGVSVSDSISITESITITNSELGGINVYDFINITDVFIGSSVVDLINITELITLQIPFLADINVSDSINISELNIEEKPLIVVINDSINITENIINYSFSNIIIWDSINISELITSVTPLLGGINKFDSVTITELIQSQISQLAGINVFDSINILEPSITYDNSFYTYDGLLTYDGYFIQIELISFILNIDSINTTELITSVTPLLGGINKFDSVTITELIQSQTPELGEINKFENINIIDVLTTKIFNLGDINIFDLIIISENFNELNILNINVFESININITDNLGFAGFLSIIVFDNITISEDITFGQNSNINVSDTILISDNFAGLENINLSVIDSILITENINVDVIANINIVDNVIISEWTKLEKFKVSHSIKRPHGSGHSIGSPQGSISTIGTPSGNMNSIGTPVGSGNSIGSPTGSMRTVGRPSGGVD